MQQSPQKSENIKKSGLVLGPKMLFAMFIALACSVGLNIFYLTEDLKRPTISDSLNLPLGYQAFKWPRSFGNRPLLGAIVEIAPGTGFEYIGHLEKCGLDRSDLTPNEGILYLPNVSSDQEINVTLSNNTSNILGNIGISNNSKIKFKTGPVKEKFLVTGDVILNSINKIDLIKERCGNLLESPNIYWITHVLIAETVDFQFSTKSDQKIEITDNQTINASKYLGFEAERTSNVAGGIKASGPIYVGFRGAYPLEIFTGKTFSFSGNETNPRFTLGDDVYREATYD